MLLTCPHCTDVAEIPSVFRKFYGMPIACHACSGVFYVPKKISSSKQRSVLSDYQKQRCSSCRVTLLVPDLTQTEANLSREAYETGLPTASGASMLCPACKADISTDRLWPAIQTNWKVERILPLMIGGAIGSIVVYSNQHGYLAFDGVEAAQNLKSTLHSFWNGVVDATRSFITSIEDHLFY